MMNWMRRSLGWKLFVSYLVVMLLAIMVTVLTIAFLLPSAFSHRMESMDMMSGGMMDGMMGGSSSEGTSIDLLDDVRAIVSEAVFFAVWPGALVAAGVAWYITRRIVAPVEHMQGVAGAVAQGDYDARIRLDKPEAQYDELDQLSASLNQMTDSLSQTEARRQQLIGDVSHELRTPLTTIRGMMEALMDGVVEPDAAAFQQVHREATRLGHLVDDLQELSRVEAEGLQLVLAPVDVSALIEKLAAQFAPQYEQNGVSLQLDLPETPVQLALDEDRVVQVLTNLVGNALQYTSSGDRVSVSCTQKDEFAEIEIRDNGIGIAAAHLPHIFERFYRVDKSRARVSGGSGVGLTIARRIVALHGGTITVDSAGEGRGSAFLVRLPLG